MQSSIFGNSLPPPIRSNAKQMQKMKETLLIGAFCMVQLSCDRPDTSPVVSPNLAGPNNGIELTFRKSVYSSLEDKGAVVILDQVLEPGEEVTLPDVVGAASVGYFIDDQFELSKAGSFVQIYGSDGLESGSDWNGEWRRNSGTIQASYIAVNKGSLRRRLLVYRTNPDAL